MGHATEVVRKYVPVLGKFVFLRGDVEIAREWVDDEGNVRIEGEIPDGVVKTYYEDGEGRDDGRLYAEWNYKDGQLDGISKIYYENGELEEELYYADGKVDEVLKRYYENGHPCFETTEASNGRQSCRHF
jgi:antitoxin component YwqK of YwqJK toxin-antitoxin module